MLVKTSEEVTRNSAGGPRVADRLLEVGVSADDQCAPDTTDASTSSGLTVGVHVPQTAAQNPDGSGGVRAAGHDRGVAGGRGDQPVGWGWLGSVLEGLAGFQWPRRSIG